MVATMNVIDIEILVRVGSGEPIVVGTASVPVSASLVGHTLLVGQPDTQRALHSALRSALRATKPKRWWRR